MSGNRSIFRFRRSLPDRDGIDDLTLGVPVHAGVSRAAHAPLRAQAVQQLFFQYSSRLNEQAAVNGLVGHSHAPVIGILGLQPPRNLFRRPVQHQFTRNDVAQLSVRSQKTGLRSGPPFPSLLIRLMSTIGRTATMACDLPANRRGCSIESAGDLTKRGAGSDASRDVLSLSEREG